MADDIDRANDQAQYLLDIALQRSCRVPSSRISAQFCADCGEAIPLLRQQTVVGCQTCVDCQGLREAQGRAMSPGALKVVLAGVLLLVLATAGGIWKVQDWRYGKKLAEQDGLHQSDLNTISNAAATAQRTEQDKRLALEQRLSASEQVHYKELSDAQTKQARLRDRLATADLRLSVLLDTTDSASGCSVSAHTSARGVVHGGARAQLDPAHAQRIVGITDSGDQGLIALAACQAFVRELKR